MSGPIRQPWAGPLGLYHPGTTLIHRAPAGLKLAFLAVFAVAVVAARGPASALAVLGVALLAQLVARIPWHRTTRGLVPALVTAALIGLYQWWARVVAVTTAPSRTRATRSTETSRAIAHPRAHHW